MRKFLYLTQRAWADAWIDGGEVPLNLASAYRAAERAGTMTPDEGHVHISPVNLDLYMPAIRISGEVRNLTMLGNTMNGRPLPDMVGANVARYEEDGLILSLCDVEDRSIAERLGKSCCVCIEDVKQLKVALDRQLKKRSVMGPCRYTADHQRTPFLKSQDDGWQREFRIYWKGISTPAMVTIPKGTAKLVAEY